MIRGMKHYHHLTIHEREQIKVLVSQGQSLRTIGRELGRDHKTIERELLRNSPSLGKAAYCPSRAHTVSMRRRAMCKTKRLAEGALHSYVIRRLGKGWSPETIAGRLKRIHAQETASYETIYQFIYSKEGKRERLSEFLRRGHQRRQSWSGRKAQTRKRLEIPGRINISERPKEAKQRRVVGHLETDLMEGSRVTGGAVSVTVDRKSGLVLLDKLASKTSRDRIGILINRLARFPRALTKTMTMDNGTENTEHQRLQESLGCQTYFCNPYHSWEKGTVGNTIGLVRSWVPKGTDLATITQADLNTIADELNHRPRKRLGFLTPSEVLLQELNWGT